VLERRGWRQYRTLGIAFPVVAVLLAVMNGKAHYLGGAVALDVAESSGDGGTRRGRRRMDATLSPHPVPLPEFVRFRRVMELVIVN